MWSHARLFNMWWRSPELYAIGVCSFAMAHFIFQHLFFRGMPERSKQSHAAHLAVALYFSVIAVTMGMYILLFRSTPHFYEGGLHLENYPATHPISWWALCYFSYELGHKLLERPIKPEFILHAMVSLLGATGCIYLQRGQIYYVYLVTFGELSSLFLLPRSILIICNLTEHYPRLFAAVSVLFIVAFTVARIVVLNYRYVVHMGWVWREYTEGAAYCHGKETPLWHIIYDVVATTSFTCLNLFWWVQMLAKVKDMVTAKKRTDTSPEKDTKKSK